MNPRRHRRVRDDCLSHLGSLPAAEAAGLHGTTESLPRRSIRDRRFPRNPIRYCAPSHTGIEAADLEPAIRDIFLAPYTPACAGRDHLASLGARDAGAAHLAGRVDYDWRAAGASKHSAARCHRRAAAGRQRRAVCATGRPGISVFARRREPCCGSSPFPLRDRQCGRDAVLVAMGCATASSRRLSMNSCCRAL